eukprot:2519328-Rhodomonas_salina.3
MQFVYKNIQFLLSIGVTVAGSIATVAAQAYTCYACELWLSATRLLLTVRYAPTRDHAQASVRQARAPGTTRSVSCYALGLLRLVLRALRFPYAIPGSTGVSCYAAPTL